MQLIECWYTTFITQYFRDMAESKIRL